MADENIIVPTPKQWQLIRCPANEILWGGAAGGGKALKAETLVMTPGGFVPIVDLAVGDTVCTPFGDVARVVATTGVFMPERMFRFTFSDGSQIECDAGHLWHTMTDRERSQLARLTPEFRASRRLKRPRRGVGIRPDNVERNESRVHRYKPPPTGSLKTALQVHETAKVGKSGRSNHSIAATVAIAGTDCELPIDPYLLGLWLGDGSSNSGSITSADPQVFESVSGDTVRVPSAKYLYRVVGLTKQLRTLGVLENKHIPEPYLSATAPNRLAMLQGLMDTDGWADPDGQASFCNTNKAIVDGVARLVRSLGWIPYVWSKIPKCNGKECARAWCVAFHADKPVFRLERKSERQKTAGFRASWGKFYITNSEEIEPQPSCCIQLDDPRGMYLAGESMIPTHNSLGILLDWNAHHAQYKGAAAGLILRRTNPQLEEILRMAKMMFANLPGAPSWNDKQRQFNYGDGAFLRFGYLDNYDDVFNYIGHAFTARYHDELTAWNSDEEYNLLNTRMRSTKGVPIRIVNTTNPGGPGHQWVMRRWHIDQHPQGYVPFMTYSDVKSGKVLTPKECDPGWDKLVDSELPEGIIRWTRMFIPSRLEDNPHLDKGGQYRAQLMTKDKRTRAMLLEGRWDVIEGAFFSEWEPSAHVVQPFEIPASWRRFCAMDWGTWSPYAVLWAAESPYGEVYIYRELYGGNPDKPNMGVNEPPSVVADKIKRIEQMSEEYIHERYLDDSCWKGERAGEVTIAQQFASGGVPFQPARRFNKVAAINNLKDWLKVVNGKSRLMVFSTCKNLIRTMPILQIDRNNPDQFDTKGEDHLVDATIYLMRRYMHDEGRNRGGMSVEDLNKRKIGVYSGMGVW